MYEHEFRENLEKDLQKLAKKDSKIIFIIEKKIKEIVENPQHYKNMRAPLQHLKRVHVNNCFVLVFSVDEVNKRIVFEELDHHDNIYIK